MSSYLGPALTRQSRSGSPAGPARWRSGVVPVIAFTFLATPVITTISFFVVYAAADASPHAPMGDTAFAWMPLLYALFVAPVWCLVLLVGLAALVWQAPSRAGFRAAWALVAACVLTVLWVFVSIPHWGGPEGFPDDASVRGMAAVGVAVSLAPSSILAWWLSRRAWALRDGQRS
jgi:hypothetical protein